MMMLKLVLTIAGVLVALALGAQAFRGVFQARLEARRRRELGALNASESCSLCFEPVNPTEDFYDRKMNRWSHAECVRLLLNPDLEGDRT